MGLGTIRTLRKNKFWVWEKRRLRGGLKTKNRGIDKNRVRWWQAGELVGECGGEIVSKCASEFVVVRVCECVLVVVGDFVGIFNVSSDIIRFFGRERDRILLWPRAFGNKNA